MQFKQINAVQVGADYMIIIYALSDEGQLYAGKTHAGNLEQVDWKQVKHPIDQ